MDSQQSLVDLIFTKCGLVYGRDFLSRWEGMDIGEVKADWRRELGSFLNDPQAIKYGLENLPADKPPTVLQFRAVCNRRPDPPVAMLPAPKPTPEEKERVRVLLKKARDRLTKGAQ